MALRFDMALIAISFEVNRRLLAAAKKITANLIYCAGNVPYMYKPPLTG